MFMENSQLCKKLHKNEGAGGSLLFFTQILLLLFLRRLVNLFFLWYT